MSTATLDTRLEPGDKVTINWRNERFDAWFVSEETRGDLAKAFGNCLVFTRPYDRQSVIELIYRSVDVDIQGDEVSVQWAVQRGSELYFSNSEDSEKRKRYDELQKLIRGEQ